MKYLCGMIAFLNRVDSAFRPVNLPICV
jgi:hypothetical protein